VIERAILGRRQRNAGRRVERGRRGPAIRDGIEGGVLTELMQPGNRL